MEACKKFIVWGLLAGALIAAVWGAGRGAAQIRTDLFSGAGNAGNHIEPTFKFPTLKGNFGRLRPQRSILIVPEDYGEVFAATGDSGRSILWYRSPTGIVRNIVIHDPAQLIAAIQPKKLDELRATHDQ